MPSFPTDAGESKIHGLVNCHPLREIPSANGFFAATSKFIVKEKSSPDEIVICWYQSIPPMRYGAMTSSSLLSTWESSRIASMACRRGVKTSERRVIWNDVIYLMETRTVFMLFHFFPRLSFHTYRLHNKLFDGTRTNFFLRLRSVLQIPTIPIKITNLSVSLSPLALVAFVEKRDSFLDVFNGFSCCQRYCLVMFVEISKETSPHCGRWWFNDFFVHSQLGQHQSIKRT